MSCNLIFDPIHFLNLSNELKDNKGQLFVECDCKIKHCIYRTIISRSYYSAFSRSEAKIKKTKLKSQLKSKKSELGHHWGVIDLVSNINPAVPPVLEGLKEFRETADYDLDALIDKEIMDKSIENANKIIGLLK